MTKEQSKKLIPPVFFFFLSRKKANCFTRKSINQVLSLSMRPSYARGTEPMDLEMNPERGWTTVVFTKRSDSLGFVCKDENVLRNNDDSLRSVLTSARIGEEGWRRMDTRVDREMMQYGALLLVDPHVLLTSNVESDSDISRNPVVVKDATVTPEGSAFSYLITVCIRTREGATIYTVDYVDRANKDVDDFLEALDDLERTKAQPVYVICSQDSVAGMARVVAEKYGQLVASFDGSECPAIVAGFVHNPNDFTEPTCLRCVYVEDDA